MPHDKNWRPKLSRIDDPIAEDHWEYVTPDGEQRISELVVGRPVHYPEERLWYCPVLIEGYTRPRIKPIFGSGPVDSLMNAMTFVRRFFEANSEVLPGVKPRRSKRAPSTRAGKPQSPQAKPRRPPR
jgi:hypothetical protein